MGWDRFQDRPEACPTIFSQALICETMEGWDRRPAGRFQDRPEACPTIFSQALRRTDRVNDPSYRQWEEDCPSLSLCPLRRASHR
jgi:hypothetical protein